MKPLRNTLSTNREGCFWSTYIPIIRVRELEVGTEATVRPIGSPILTEPSLVRPNLPRPKATVTIHATISTVTISITKAVSASIATVALVIVVPIAAASKASVIAAVALARAAVVALIPVGLASVSFEGVNASCFVWSLCRDWTR